MEECVQSQTLSMKGGRRWQASSTIGVIKVVKSFKTNSGRIWNTRMETKLQRLQQKGCNYRCDRI